MPEYLVTGPDGKQLKLTGDSPPTDEELEQIFAERFGEVVEHVNVQRGMQPGSALEAASAGNPTIRMGPVQTQVAAYGAQLPDALFSIKQMTGQVGPAAAEERKQRNAPLESQPGALAGEMALGVPFNPTTLPGMAALGGLFGALEPTGEGDSRFGNTFASAAAGGLAKGGFDLLGMGLGKTARAAASYSDAATPGQTGRALREASGDRADDFTQALRDNPNLTLREAAAASNSPELAALIRLSEDFNPQLRNDLIQRQNEQLGRQIRRLGGTSESLQRAITQRGGNWERRLQESFSQPLNPTERFTELLDDPFVQRIIRSDQFKRIIGSQNVEAGTTQYYHLIKKGLDDALDTAGTTGMGESEQAAIRAIKREFVDELGKSNPAYDAARIAFQEESVPVNRMQVGQALEQRLFAPDQVPIQETRSRQFLESMRGGDEFAQRATGYSGARMDDVLGSFRQADDISQTLRRNDTFNALADSGRRAAGEALEDVKPGQLPGLLERHVVIANSLLSRAGKHETKSILEFLSQNLDRPQEIARLVQNASPDEHQAVRTIISAIRQGLPMAVAAGAN